MNWLLSDEFVTFSQKISEIHSKKKALKAELKEFYDKISFKIQSLDKEANTLNEEFENWRNSQEADKTNK